MAVSCRYMYVPGPPCLTGQFVGTEDDDDDDDDLPRRSRADWRTGRCEGEIGAARGRLVSKESLLWATLHSKACGRSSLIWERALLPSAVEQGKEEHGWKVTRKRTDRVRLGSHFHARKVLNR